MRIIFSIPEPIARRFQAFVPSRQRSRLVTHLLEEELAKREQSLETACRAANADKALEKEVDEWQAFDDGIIE